MRKTFRQLMSSLVANVSIHPKTSHPSATLLGAYFQVS